MSRSRSSTFTGRGTIRGTLERLITVGACGLLLTGVVGPLTPPPVRAEDQSGAAAQDEATKGQDGNVTEAKVAPITTPAGGGGKSSVDPTIGGAPEFLPPTPPASKSEVAEDRTRQTRTFANPDGSFTLEAADGPINYQDQTGAWQPIDLSLVPDGEGGYKVAANVGDIRVDTTDGSIGSIAVDGHKVSLSAPGYASGNLGTALDSNKVTYNDALGTAAAVWVQPTDIGLEFGASWADAITSRVVSFVVDPGDLTPALAKDDRTIEFTDADGKFAGVISQPIIREGGPDGPPLLDVVSVALVPLGDRSYLLSYTLDEKWLTDAKRVFPVLLDPDWCVGAGASGCSGGNTTAGVTDTFVYDHSPDNHEIGWTTIRTGYDVRTDEGTYDAMRSIVYFPWVGLPDGAVIYDTDLQLTVCCNYGNGQGQTIYADRLTKKLTLEYTWNKFASAFSTTEEVSGVVPAAGSNMHLDVDKIVTAWYTRRPGVGSPVYGIMLRMASEDSSHGEVEFRRKTSNAADRPLLTIHYTIPSVGINFDPRLGPTYAPSSMVAGITTKLPILVTNKAGSAHTLDKCIDVNDTDCWKVGYRWFDGKGNLAVPVTDAQLTDLPANIAVGATSTLFPISVIPPPTTGQYTLALDVVHWYTNTRGWASDFASPALYYSRNKNVLTADSTRWTGSSKIERDEFSINVTEGVGAGPVQTVSDGAGGQLGVDLGSHNLSYQGDSGLGFADRLPLSLTYGFNEAPTCAGYLGVLGACGWHTNWDERIVGGSNQTGFDYTYFGPDGTPAMVDTDLDGQLIGGAPVLLNRQRVTMLDENGGWDGGDGGTAPDIPAVASGDGGITAFTGSYMAKLSSDANPDVNQPDKISLNVYRRLRFAIQATVADRSALCFKIHNLTDPTIIDDWYCLTVGFGDWSTGEDQKFYTPSGTIHGVWKYVDEDLYNDVRLAGPFGTSKDDYQVLTIRVRSAGVTGGSTYLDAFRFESDETTFLDESNPAWTTGSSITTTDHYVGSTSVRISPAGTTISPKCDTTTSCWSTASGGTWAYPFFDWYWKKTGGTSAAFLFFLNDEDTSTACTLTYYTGSLPKLAGLPACNAMIRIDDSLPTTWTRVRRNVSEDARQALGLYDAAGDGTGDNIRVTGWAPLAIDGGWLLIDQLSYGNLADVASVDETNPAGALAGEKTHPSSAGDTTFTWDFSADYADGSRHYFNRDGLLVKIRTRDGQSTSLDWSFNLALAGATAYSLTTIHAPGDGATSGATTFERQFSVTYGTDGSSSTVRFDEDLGKTGSGGDSSDRAVIFERTTGKDLIKVSPARTHTAIVGPTGSFCGTRPNGCVEFSYLSGHLLQFVADPRWDGSTSGANYYRLEIVHTGTDPMSIKDDSHGGANLLNVLTYSDPAASLYVRPQWQDAAAAAANAAIAIDLSPDGRTLTEYSPRACNGTCSTSSGTWPTATLQGDYKTVDYLFDGLSRVNSVITYRCPKASTAISGCTGSSYLLTETRSETNARAKVDNYADPLAAGQLVWRASADQVFASLRDSGGRNTDLYRTEYRYDGSGAVSETIEVRQLETSTYADTVKLNSAYAHWRLNETSGTSMADSSGNSRNGTYTVTPTLGGVGALVRDAANKAPTFNGSSQYAKATNTQMGSVTGTFTVEAWVRSTSGTTSQTFVGSRGPSNYGFDLKLCPDTCTGGPGIRFDIGSGTAWLYSSTVPFEWVAGPWYHVAVVVDGTADTATVYVDGQLAGGGPFTTAGTPVLTNATHDLYIGQTGLASFNEWFAGQIDEVAVYTTALPAADIARHNRAGRGIATVDTTVIHDNVGHPIETASSFVIDPGFEQIGTGWAIGSGATIDTAAANAHSGWGSLKTASVATTQVVQLVPGQTFRFQFATSTSVGTTPVHVKLQSGSAGNTWTVLGSIDTDYTNTSWTVRAFDVTLPMTTDGRVRVSFSQTGAGIGRVDDVIIVTHWASVTYSGSAGIGLGLPTDTYGLAACQGGPCTTATIRTQLGYTAGTTGPDYYPAIFPASVTANYIASPPLPGPDINVTSLATYDSWGRKLVATDPDGVTSTTVYDTTTKTDVAQTKDGVDSITAMTYDEVGNVRTTTTPLLRVTTSTYDVRNHQLTSTGPDGVVSRTDYDNYGRATASWANYVDGNPTNGDGSDDLLSTSTYDAFGNAIQQDVDCGSVATCATGGLDARTTTIYDLLGNVVASTSKPGAGGTGTARTTTNFFGTVVVGSDTYSATKASGVRLPIAPSAGPAPVCPGSSAFCNSVTTLDLSGRGIAATDAYGIITKTALDLDGHAVRTIAAYVDGTPGPGADADVTTTAAYNLAGDAYLTTDPAGRSVLRTFDALGRLLKVSHRDTGSTEFLAETTTYLPSGRVDYTNDGASNTATQYDGAGRAIRTIANSDETTGYAGMTLDGLEGTAGAWRIDVATGTPFFITSAAAAKTDDTDSAGNAYGTVAPVSGRGRLRVTTHATNTNDGAWLDISGPTYQSGHTYKAAFDLATSAAGLSLTAYLGQDASGGSYGSLGITSTTTWTRYTVSWTAGSSLTTPIRFALRKAAAGTSELYLDNLVVWDSTVPDRGIVSSATSYDIDGEVIASVLPPGDPATERPLVTTVAFDPAGRTVQSVTNGVSGGYAATILGSGNLTAYFPLDERIGVAATDKTGGGSLLIPGTLTIGFAGGIDEARTGVRLTGSNGYLSRASNATSNTTNVSTEAWIRTDTTPAATVVVASNGTATNGWGIALDSAGKASGFTLSGSTFTTMASSITVSNGAWHHLVLTRGASTWAMTVDGAAQGLSNNTTSPGTPGAGFSVGALSDGTRPFVGEIDEVSAYTADISGATAAAHWAAGRRPSTDTTTALTTRNAYDRLGRVIDAWAPDLVRTKATYDRLGNQTQTVANYRDGLTTGGAADDDVISTFAYDVLGELVGYCPAVQVKSGGSCAPATGSEPKAWHYVFDAMGRQTTTVPPVNTAAVALTTEEVVYETGGRVAKTCRYPVATSCGSVNSRHVDFTYDNLGRILTQKTWDRAAGSDALKFTKTLTWNADGSQATVADDTPNSPDFSYVYDTAGRLSQFKTGSTVLTAYTYTSGTSTIATRTDGTQGATAFTYDWARRQTVIDPPDAYVTGTVSRSYRLDGLLATQAFPSSISETLAYDAAKRPTSISLGSAGSISQAFDRAGRVTSDGRSLTGITGDAGTGTQNFYYDGLSRLTSSNGLTVAPSYQYDLDGNRTSKVEGGTTTTYTYDRADQVANQVIGATTRTYDYDRYGNLLTSADNTSAVTTYAYDEASRLTTINPPTGGQVTFTVDALDRHATKLVGGTLSDTYAYLDATETAWQTGTGTTSSLLDASGSRLAVKTGSTVSWLVFDLHGSVAALCTSGTSTITDAYRFDGFGQQIAPTGSGGTTNPWRYRGLLNIGADSSTGALLDMGARDYSPQLGQFTQLDSVQGSAANPMTMNRFLYALANPATLIDPDGHDGFDPFGFLGGVVSVGVGIAAAAVTTVVAGTVGLGAVALGAVAGAVASVASDFVSGRDVSWESAVSGAAAGATFVVVAGATGSITAGGAAAGAVGDLVAQGIDLAQGERTGIDLGEVGISAALGAGFAYGGARAGRAAASWLGRSQNNGASRVSIDDGWTPGTKAGRISTAGENRFAKFGRDMHTLLQAKVRAKGNGWDWEPKGLVGANGKTYKPDIRTPRGYFLEYKPNTPSGRAAGARQAAIYEAQLGVKTRVIYYRRPPEF